MGPTSSKMERIKVGTHHGTAQLMAQILITLETASLA